MPTVIGSLRRLGLTPSLRSVTFAARGFPVTETAATRRLEAIPEAVICGFEWAIDMRGQWELERRLDLVEPEMRGFAYEGATMACTVLDAMAAGRGHRARDLLSGPAVPHTFLTYIGIGFAMARLPRPLWRTVLPDLTGTPYYPTMSWLAVDGYGFDRAYFDTATVVTAQRRLRPYPWLGRADYFPHAVDQGIGRALWFIHGGVAPAVTAAVDRFPAERRADLWSGVGLAATFAGGCEPAGLATLRRDAGAHPAHLAQGSVFAAKARAFSGYEPAHTAGAVGALTGLTVPEAVALADEATTIGVPASDGRTEYEVWRAAVRRHFDAVPSDVHG
jgi:enediyne biosynthesis protein E2